MNLTQTLSAGIAQGFYFTAPSSSFKIKISYSNYYTSWKRCCLLIDNVVISSTAINSQVACLKDKYRFGFNGMEKDDEVKGSGNLIHYELREYDSRLGKMISIDPRQAEYPWQSSYAYFSNSPIWKIDYLGGGDDKKTASNPNNPDSKQGVEKFHQETKRLVKDNLILGLKNENIDLKKNNAKLETEINEEKHFKDIEQNQLNSGAMGGDPRHGDRLAKALIIYSVKKKIEKLEEKKDENTKIIVKNESNIKNLESN